MPIYWRFALANIISGTMRCSHLKYKADISYLRKLNSEQAAFISLINWIGLDWIGLDWILFLQFKTLMLFLFVYFIILVSMAAFLY
jgi:hypothetical protein